MQSNNNININSDEEIIDNKFTNISNAEIIEEKNISIENKEATYDKGDILLAFFLLFIAYLGSKTFSIVNEFDSYGIGISILHISYSISIFFYAVGKNNKSKVNKEALFWLISIILVSISYTFILNESISIYLSLFLRFSTLYYTFLILGGLNLKVTSDLFFIDILNMYILMPLKSLHCLFICIFKSISKNKIGHGLLKILLGIIIPIPLIAIIIALLSSADNNFSLIIEGIIKNINENLIKNIFIFIFSVPAAIYLFALSYGTKYERRKLCINLDETQAKSTFDKFSIVPALSIYSLLFIICTLYIIFIYLQGSYYTGALSGNLPSNFTYSEYARSGFFQLCSISVLNLSIIFIANMICKKDMDNKKPKLLTLFILGMIILTFFLIFTAMAKMLMYISNYGLTPLRIIPSIFMIWLFFIYILLLINQFIKLNIVKIGLLSLSAILVILSLINIDKAIADYNINRFVNGSLNEDVLNSSTIAWLPVIENNLSDELSKKYPDKYEALYNEKSSLLEYSEYRLDYKDRILSLNMERNKIADIKY